MDLFNSCFLILVKMLWNFSSFFTDQNIIAEPGGSTGLSCQAPNNNFLSVKWIRADLGEKYVFLYRDVDVDTNNQLSLDGNFDPTNQHPSFQNRVDLQDRQMKDGDVSLILNNVTINDTGTYECLVFMNETWKPINNITLSVVDPPGHLK
ncbi:uncharacterized protein LOC109200039 isoform X2 [Oreochromis niloticus]|uniref:uncharacterized protein LOC109200039 isoform X2 n=1 Tax=Oreochromis niloticus TaxID=8128 RepID=UPI000DF1472D|nr:uncharacterized protein LOC109200039 isoform X2 [Oreochromis niloticus]